MLVKTKQHFSTTHPKILFIDQQERVPSSVVDTISNQLNAQSVTIKGTIPPALSQYDCLFYFVDEYSGTTISALGEVFGDWNGTNEKCVILIHDNYKDKDLFPYLKFCVNGIVSLSFLKKHCGLMLNHLLDKGVFLEPNLHQGLVKEIETRKMKDLPIKKLVLKKEQVIGILSPNEQDVLQLILDGLNNRQIAEHLYLAQSTVSTIISHLLRKIQANDRTDAMVKAIRNGWVEANR
ncbi:LuxR C-terminal-related transcriptional regulator [Evansella sp. AB-P1]|uniref:response regulator transcription factor n=1 Tax=Evansella sp. AB-P1 TaxID=3037653 RepID=UPI00241DB870|nr:LuxR C-terminal-related transcriptional regulator [Evansella sp. AB-P1]MDG5786670.1 LuxR C-terminal-related transcriptional regulator [Evansella sp. AB-P1]